MNATRFVALLVVAFFSCTAAYAATIRTVPVGNRGNPALTLYDPNGFGSVDYNYLIGTFPVTNDQYTAFLNAVAADDPVALYNTQMDSSTHGGITRSGSSGSFKYATKPGMENKPVVFVSWYDAIRFANWLHNGQRGPGTTEDGAYTLLDGTPTPSNGNSITRNPGAKWFLPSEDEWYKAAYHRNDGVTFNYWVYPTGTNDVPAAEPPPGGANSANYANAVGTVSDVGAYVDSPSPYRTFDQGGNVWEWNEALIMSCCRGVRGSSWSVISSGGLHAGSFRYSVDPSFGGSDIGFRVASIPEPASISGDFNHDGTVDAADYVLWRKTRGPALEYEQWRANFGASSKTGAAAAITAHRAAVPEPSTIVLVGLGICLRCVRVSRRAHVAPRSLRAAMPWRSTVAPE